MDLHDFCQKLGFDATAENFLFPNWPKLQAHATPDFPFFMEAKFYEKYLPWCQLPPDVSARMAQVAAITARHPICCRYANLLYYALYLATPEIPVNALPLLDQFYGENAGIFHTMIGLAALPLIARKHQELGLPETMLPETATLFRGTNAIFAAAHQGQPGYLLRQLYWLRWHIEGKLFRIGRLEYLMGPLYTEIPAIYEQRQTGNLAVLCRDNWHFNAQGQRLAELTPETVFTARLTTQGGKITGTPISATGEILFNQTRTLDTAEWSPICAPWEMVPSIHIPGGSPLTLESIKTSLQQAVEFFRTYFHQGVKLFTCCSWIFDPVWEQELPHSHLSEFQRQVYVTAPLQMKHCGTFFVYGEAGDPRQHPVTNHLHEAFCRIYDQKRELCYGAMFIRTAEIEKFGGEFYRTKYGKSTNLMR